MYLLDTCVVSELRRPVVDPGVVSLLDSLDPNQLFLSVLTLGEIRRGIDLLDPGRRRQELTLWLNGLRTHFAGQLLPVDDMTAELWGQLSAAAQLKGSVIGAVDQLLAATAIRHGFTFVTRNAKHFDPLGVKLLNPWLDAASPDA